MPINSRRKGVRVELLWTKVLRNFGGLFSNARRGQQYCGVAGDADVVDGSHIFWEVKGVQALNINKVMARAAFDCPKGKVPAVAHKKNGEKFLVTIRAKDMVAFAEEVVRMTEGEQNNG